jgi:hypothetical protein
VGCPAAALCDAACDKARQTRQTVRLHPEPAFGFTSAVRSQPTPRQPGDCTPQVTVRSAVCVLFVPATGSVARSPDSPPTPDTHTRPTPDTRAQHAREKSTLVPVARIPVAASCGCPEASIDATAAATRSTLALDPGSADGPTRGRFGWSRSPAPTETCSGRNDDGGPVRPIPATSAAGCTGSVAASQRRRGRPPSTKTATLP